MREVKELQAQESAHFSAREKALADALSKATDETAKKNLQWKSAKDRYEQAALNDIHKADTKRVNITEEGEKQFQEYAHKAQELTGVRDLHALLNITAKRERSRQSEQQSALSTLQSTEHELHQIEAEQRAMAEAKDRRTQAQASSKEQSHLSHILTDSEQGRSAGDDIVSQYRSDIKAATQEQAARARAFEKAVAAEKTKEERARESRTRILRRDHSDEHAVVRGGGGRPEQHAATVRERADEDVKQFSESVGITQRFTAPRREEDVASREMSSSSYERQEAAAAAAAEAASRAEQQAHTSFLRQRADRLASDSAASQQLSKQLEAAATRLLEPSQVADAAPSHDDASLPRVAGQHASE